jgi:hypothetical protein
MQRIYNVTSAFVIGGGFSSEVEFILQRANVAQ